MERVLQFGTGRFLRGFVDAFIDDANTTGLTPARAVTVVETTGSGMAARLATQGFAYRLLVRGLQGGRIVDTSRVVRSIDRTVDATVDPDGAIEAALDPDLRFVVSNTTGPAEATSGLPARLSAVLEARARSGLPGLVILPCELVEHNGARLREQVLADAGRRGLQPSVVEHVRDANCWANTLVDRIATMPGPNVTSTFGDPLAVAVEPFACWVVEIPLVPIIEHAAVLRTADVLPFALRKLRILNGAHTALVARTRGMGVTFVREAMEAPGVAAWLEALVIEEIVPALADRIVDGEGFARTVLERFRNPFLDHRLSDIAADHSHKLAIRLVPTHRDHVARFGRSPRLLGQVLAQEGVAP